MTQDSFVRNARVDRVIDGDTVDLVVDMGWKMSRVVRFRLLGINTPELRSSDPLERLHAKAARDFVERTLANWASLDPGLEFPLWVASTKTGKYGRWLGIIGSRNSGVDSGVSGMSGSLNQLLLDRGHAVPYE